MTRRPPSFEREAAMIRFNLCALMLLTLALLLAAPCPARAAESYDNCTGTITSLPAVISTQGTWCLKTDLATAITSGQAILINTDNVTIDCNDFKLGGLAAGSGTLTIGIEASNRSNLTVRHCNIRGFYTGVSFDSSGGGHTIEDNRFDGNTYQAMLVLGDGSVVRRNRVFNTGGSTQNATAIGISTYESVDVLDNTVSGVLATSGGGGGAMGIYTQSNLNGRIVGNGVRGLVKDNTGAARAIFAIFSDRITLRKNDLVGDGGSVNSLGLYCGSANGRAKDNTISGFETARIGCNDSGGNAVLP
jgi:hypothetical protein